MLKGESGRTGAGPHILLYGQFGVGNSGNDATLLAAHEGLSKRLPDARFTVVAGAPDVVERELGLSAVAISPEGRASLLPKRIEQIADEWRRTAHARRVLRSADFFIVPGTGIFDDLNVTPIQHAFPMWRWCAQARSARVPVLFVSVGAGPVEREASRRLFAWTAALANWRSFRDQSSRAFVRDSLHVDVANDVVTPDLVFSLGLATPAPAARRTIGVGVMGYHSWRGARGGGDDIYEDYMGKLAQFCAELIAQGDAIRVLLGDAGDLSAADDLVQRLRAQAPGAAVSVAPARDFRGICAEVVQTDAVVATRFHTVLAALMCGRPVVSIGYAVKNRNIMTAFGLGAYCQDIWDYDPQLLRAHFTALTANPNKVYAQLRTVAEKLRGEVNVHLDALEAYIKSRARQPG